jgi:hypothetical protein
LKYDAESIIQTTFLPLMWHDLEALAFPRNFTVFLLDSLSSSDRSPMIKHSPSPKADIYLRKPNNNQY